MANSMRVDFEVLTKTADVMSELGVTTTGTEVGQTLAGAAGALPGMATAGALQTSGARVDASCRAIGDEFDALSANLSAAVRKYGATDERSGEAITQVADTMAP